jgi:uncharacterized protein
MDSEQQQELLACARYGELQELQEWHQQQNKHSLAEMSLTQDTQGNTLLHYAAANGHADILEFLLSDSSTDTLKSLCDHKNKEGSTALHWAALNGRLEAVQVLLNKGATPTLVNGAGKSAMTLAATSEHQEVTHLLLNSYNPDDEDDDDCEEDGQLEQTETEEAPHR